MYAAGIWIYTLSTRPRDLIGVVAFWGLVFFLGAIYVANVFGPPPPSESAIAIAGAAGAVLFTVWSWWLDRHRESG
jgi:apolipoprotein N-acyltransferase